MMTKQEGVEMDMNIGASL